MQSVTYEPIGVIHSPHTQLEGMPIQPAGAAGVKGWIEVDPRYEEGLRDLDGFSHVILLYHFHQSSGYQLTVKPFMDKTPRGLFSTRAPRRPNPIGLSIVRLVGLQGYRMEIENVDILDGTPLLDIKPYAPAFDRVDGVRSGWLTPVQDDVNDTRSDDRFVE